jgi:hypothetical protein
MRSRHALATDGLCLQVLQICINMFFQRTLGMIGGAALLRGK